MALDFLLPFFLFCVYHSHSEKSTKGKASPPTLANCSSSGLCVHGAHGHFLSAICLHGLHHNNTDICRLINFKSASSIMSKSTPLYYLAATGTALLRRDMEKNNARVTVCHSV